MTDEKWIMHFLNEPVEACDFMSEEETPKEDSLEDFTEEEEEVSNDEESDENNIVGKDKNTVWQKRAPTRYSQVQKSAPYFSGASEAATSVKTPTCCWELMFDEKMINLIVESTNLQIEEIKIKYSRERDCAKTDPIEIKALIGLLYLLGVKKHGKSNIAEIWTKDMTGEELCRNVMSESRFRFLLINMRFDKMTRAEQEQIDNLASIRDIFESFVSNAKKNYTVGEWTTIDKMLLAFRGTCSFRQYRPSQRPRYGIEMFTMTDSHTCYTQNIEINTGKQPPGPYNINMSTEDIVLRLTSPIHGTGRCVLMNNWSTSYSISDKLLSYNLAMVGDIRKKSKELPKSFGNVANLQLYSSKFLFNDNKTLVTYKAKKNRLDMFLSTQHHDASIDVSTGSFKKPNIITYYDTNKSEVTLERLCDDYNVARNVRRWTMVIFFSLLNIAGINSFVLFTGNHGKGHKTRRSFLKTLALNLTAEQIQRRSSVKSLPRALSLQVQQAASLRPDLYPLDAPQSSLLDTTRKKGRCHGCSIRRTTAFQCEICRNYICLKDHTKFVCDQCIDEVIILQQNAADIDIPNASSEQQILTPRSSIKRKRCYSCYPHMQRPTAYQCDVCKSFICLKDHAKYVCFLCFYVVKREQPCNDDDIDSLY